MQKRFFGERRKLPVVLQSEAAECGLACIAMVSGYYGMNSDLFSLRKRHAISTRGATIKNLGEIAQLLNFNTRSVRLELQHVADLKMPCILHWDMSHFVTLSHVAARKITVHDPARGKRVLSMAEFSKHFTGIALELNPASNFQKVIKTSAYRLRDLMGNVIGLKRSLVQAVLLGIFLEFTAIALPFYSQLVIDESLVNADLELLKMLAIGFSALVIFRAVIAAVRGWVIATLNTDLNYQWLGNVFAHLLKLPQSYFESRQLGDIISKFSSVSSVQRTITGGFIQMIVDGLLVIGTTAMMIVYSPTLSLLCGAAVLLYAMLRGLMNQSLQDAASEQLSHSAKQQSHFYETLRGIQSVKLFGGQAERKGSWLNILVKQFGADLNMQRMSIKFQSINSVIFGIERIGVIWLGAILVLQKEFSIGMLFAFLAYRDQFSSRLSALVDRIFEIRTLRVHGDRIADIVFSRPEPEPRTVDIDIDGIEPSIELKNICFRYSANDPLVLDNISLKIDAGQCVALIGPSGCGKTTLVKIMLGLIEPTSGEVLIGGVSVDKIGLHHYRKLVATVMQDDALFTGTINENISFFAPEIDEDRIQQCAMKASIHHEIMRMPMKYNSMLGNIGSNISGGQRQRIFLARALYRSPKILVLDEATSHLDLANEETINGNIRDMRLTKIIVAHRPGTMAVADRAISLYGGKITEDAIRK